MSDIHGHLALFKKTLKKVGFDDHEILVIVGDICEKDENTPELIREIIQIQKKPEVYCVMGNCDTLAEDIYNGTQENDEESFQYRCAHKYSVLNELTDVSLDL